MDPLPLVILAPAGPDRDRLQEAFSPLNPTILDSPEAFLEREGEEWGLLVLGPGLSGEEVLSVLSHQPGDGIPWVVLTARNAGSEWVLQPLSRGHPLSPNRLMEVARNPDEKGPVLDLHWALRVVARARHDLNNPLTSGLAEVQLLLMDEHPPEVKESLETIQDQFRRLRDMVADLSRLRVPRPDALPFG